jgi:preprotein translocase subunit YajC
MNIFLLADAPKSGLFGSSTTMIFMLGMVLVFWLFFIRPQAKRAKDQKRFIEALQKGDKIVTIGGLHGKVNQINEDGTISVEINPGNYVKIERSAINMDWTVQQNKAAAASGK